MMVKQEYRVQHVASTGEENTYHTIEVKTTRTFVRSSAGGRTILEYLRETHCVDIYWMKEAHNRFKLRIL
jgi:hypothetical protein